MIVKKLSNPPAPIARHDSGDATPKDYQCLRIEMPRLSSLSQMFLDTLFGRSPAVRLMLNLATVSRFMAERSIMVVIPDGVTQGEYEVLAECDMKLTVPARIAVHELFNLKERQQFVETFRADFNRYRCRGD